MGQYWLVLGGTGSLWGSTGSLGAVLACTWLYLVSMGHYWLVLCGYGTVWGGTGWYLVVLGQNGVVLGHYGAVLVST